MKSSKIRAVAGFILLGTACAAYGQDHSLQPVERLTVVDSKGKQVGNIVGIPPWGAGAIPTVAFAYGGRLLFVGVHKNGFDAYSELFFQSTDCTGTIYAPDFDDPNRPPLVGTALVFGTEVYEALASSVETKINSYLDNSSGVAVCQPIDMQQPLRPMRFVLDLNRFFTPPFTFR